MRPWADTLQLIASSRKRANAQRLLTPGKNRDSHSCRWVEKPLNIETYTAVCGRNRPRKHAPVTSVRPNNRVNRLSKCNTNYTESSTMSLSENVGDARDTWKTSITSHRNISSQLSWRELIGCQSRGEKCQLEIHRRCTSSLSMCLTNLINPEGKLIFLSSLASSSQLWRMTNTAASNASNLVEALEQKSSQLIQGQIHQSYQIHCSVQKLLDDLFKLSESHDNLNIAFSQDFVEIRNEQVNRDQYVTNTIIFQLWSKTCYQFPTKRLHTTTALHLFEQN